MNLAELTTRAAQRVPEKVALVEAGSGSSQTYAELEREVDRVAAGLQAAGLHPGDRVAIAMPNVLNFVHAYLGILRAGGVAVPLNVMLTPIEMGRVLEDSGSRFVVAAPPFSPSVATMAADGGKVERVFTTDAWDDLVSEEAPGPVSVGRDDVAVLAYTSGTTGSPRGAILTHGNLLANLDQQMSIPDDHVRQEDVLLVALPLFHIFALNVPLGLTLLNAATALLVERFEPLEALRAIGDHKITVIFGAPTMYVAWVETPGVDQYDLSSVRLAISGAAALSEEVLHEFRSMFGVDIFEGYGMTETAPTLTTNRMAAEPKPGSIGKPLPGVELRLVDEQGNDVELGDPGEILVRGPNVFQGYWGRDDDNQAHFRDGWFHTGDVAVRDEEGYLYLVDRKRDLIIVSGFNVFPSEVENALMEDPRIEDAAVVAEAHPYTGETVKAFVIPAEGAVLTEEDVLTNVRDRLARFKCPTKVEVVDELPKQLTGKVLKRILEETA